MSHFNYILIAFISIVSVHLTTAFQPNCGSVRIKCNSHSSECCEGPCCPFLHQYEGHIITTTPPSESGAINPEPTQCPKIGEECTSLLPLSSQCCNGGTLVNGGTTSCRYTSIDNEGNQIGTCCVRNGQDGCFQDADCCKLDGYCNNGRCQRNGNGAPSQKLQNVIPQNAMPQNVRIDTRSDDVKVIDVEKNKKKDKTPNLILILVVPIMMMIVLIILFCGLYYWYYRRYIVHNKHKWINKEKETDDIDVIGGGIMECDVECDSDDNIIDNVHNDIDSSTEC